MRGKLLDAIPLTSLNGISKTQAEKLNKIGLRTIHDLLFYLPLRYEDQTKLYTIIDVKPGRSVTVSGEILKTKIAFRRKRMMTSQISDGSGILTLRFFNFSPAMKKSLAVGKYVVAYGEISRGNLGPEIIHPEYKITPNTNYLELQDTLTPIYPTTEGINQVILRKLIAQALMLFDTYVINELIPAPFNQGLISLPQAIQTLHRPSLNIPLDVLKKGQHPAQRRLIFEELLAHQLSMLMVRYKTQQFLAQPLPAEEKFKQQLLTRLPYSLTKAQQLVISEIEADLVKESPMMRLVQGDVGSGKTLVALFAAIRAIAHGKQVALMVPTDLLAEQHTNTFRQWLEPLGIQVGWLSGKQKGKSRLNQQEAIAKGEVEMIIGTHAIFQHQVEFNSLALVIIDEQHRFGVHQRLALWEKGQQHGIYPHQLIMTATPIPRTLAMTAYADLDNSIIDELPPGRTPITTVAIPDIRRNEVIQRIKNACQIEKRQVYWVCTLINDSEVIEAQAAQGIQEALLLALPELNIGLVHGRMNQAEKRKIMSDFTANKLQLLVTTTVIEVGVDVPNASLMIIENPERLGLAQLHQLRGRIGRGIVASHCFLLYKTPLAYATKLRLQVLRDSNDGFIIAQKDLEIRGPGELLGTRQAGNVEFKVANLMRDQYLLPEIRNTARCLQQHYPNHTNALIERWLPDRVQYGNV
ncbi:ATP-dependent DNA helicase RecG [Arsenophonus endosymbiont of Aleurodicus dispersus]|uniref:ATP-dependent DNA helicase RecG n=1 Tax=Arsenophonus endosymbiont of Aleurodicus dispersus TaxID=235559 RepID=UPI000EB2D946|nr:ATP-dependent DNA helicase RecG [Arsenophonus endosymbiont of Aleurodicus dispersus]VAY02240.1 ATP-dependent DNA helicase RecG [Arsenophonus endosymbiont of Aleurodicus dispersus]